MKRLRLFLFVFLMCVLIVSGCVAPKQNQYIEGISLTVGLYIPYNGCLYGIQCLNFLSGRKISISTNQNFKIESEHKLKIKDNTDYSKTTIE